MSSGGCKPQSQEAKHMQSSYDDQISLGIRLRLAEFEQNRAELPAKRARIVQLQEELCEMEASLAAQRELCHVKQLRSSVDVALIRKAHQMRESLQLLEREYDLVESKRDEEEFMLSVSHLIFDAHRPPTRIQPPKRPFSQVPAETTQISENDYGSDKDEEEEYLPSAYFDDADAAPLFELIEDPKRTRRAPPVSVSDLVDVQCTRANQKAKRILNAIEGKSVSDAPHDKALGCECGGIVLLNKSARACQSCGQTFDTNVTMDDIASTFRERWRYMTPSERDGTALMHQDTYKRRNHFKDWLSQFQAKENSPIPQEILDQIRIELRRQRKNKLDKITPAQIKRVLKDLRLTKWNEHKNLICNRISGNPPPFLSSEEERMLQEMFEELQAPFQKYKPKKRKNFLSYGYTLNKLLRILGFPRRVWGQFTLLIGRQHLQMHDETWKKMMKELDDRRALGIRWPFHASS